MKHMFGQKGISLDERQCDELIDEVIVYAKKTKPPLYQESDGKRDKDITGTIECFIRDFFEEKNKDRKKYSKP